MHRQSFQRRAAPAGRTGTSGTRRGSRPRRGVVQAVLVAAAGAGVVAGCDGTGGGGDEAASAPPADGMPVIHNRIESSRASGWAVGPALRVGGAEGEAAFGRVSDVAPRAEGGVWVLDGQSSLVAGFDEGGALVARFGGEGDGPGELRNARSVFETETGRVAVGGPFPPMLHWFEGDGEFVGALRVTESFDANGDPLPPRFALWSVTRSGRAFADLFALPSLGGGPRVRHTITGFEGDGLAGARRDTVISWTVAGTPSDPSARLPIVPTVPRWTTGPGQLVWWTPGRPYEIRAYDGSGKPVRMLTLDREAVPVTREVREAIAAGLRASAARGAGETGLVENALSRADWPDELPHVADLWVSSPDGRVFAAPYLPESFQPGAPRVLDVFEPDGIYSGVLTLPARFSPRRFAGGFVYGVETDDLELEYAVRYALKRMERAVTP